MSARIEGATDGLLAYPFFVYREIEITERINRDEQKGNGNHE